MQASKARLVCMRRARAGGRRQRLVQRAHLQAAMASGVAHTSPSWYTGKAMFSCSPCSMPQPEASTGLSAGLMPPPRAHAALTRAQRGVCLLLMQPQRGALSLVNNLSTALIARLVAPKAPLTSSCLPRSSVMAAVVCSAPFVAGSVSLGRGSPTGNATAPLRSLAATCARPARRVACSATAMPFVDDRVRLGAIQTDTGRPARPAPSPLVPLRHCCDVAGPRPAAAPLLAVVCFLPSCLSGHECSLVATPHHGGHPSKPNLVSMCPQSAGSATAQAASLQLAPPALAETGRKTRCAAAVPPAAGTRQELHEMCLVDIWSSQPYANWCAPLRMATGRRQHRQQHELAWPPQVAPAASPVLAAGWWCWAAAGARSASS